MSGLAQIIGRPRARIRAIRSAIIPQRVSTVVVEKAGADDIVRRRRAARPARPVLRTAAGRAAVRYETRAGRHGRRPSHGSRRPKSRCRHRPCAGLPAVEYGAHHDLAGRGALVISTTVPPIGGSATAPDEASGDATMPLCTTPQTSHRTTS